MKIGVKCFIVGMISMVVISSCNTSSHKHDGSYFTMFNVFGFKFSEITVNVDGEDVTVNNSVTGISKFKCRQYDDRIEYEENDGTTRVMYILDNGDLKLNENITLIRIGGNKADERTKEVIKEKKTEVMNNSTQVNKTDVEHQYALIKGVEQIGNEVRLSLDYVQLKQVGEVNGFKIVNEKSTLRNFMLNRTCEITNCLTDTELNVDNVVKYKNDLISLGKTEKLVICDIKNGEVVSLNIGCFN